MTDPKRPSEWAMKAANEWHRFTDSTNPLTTLQLAEIIDRHFAARIAELEAELATLRAKEPSE